MRRLGSEIRSRRGLVVAVLITLVALFAARAVVHHVADDAAPAALTAQHHEEPGHGLPLDLFAAATGFLLLGGLLFGATLLAKPRYVSTRLGRLARLRIGPPSTAPPYRRACADLQTFLT